MSSDDHSNKEESVSAANEASTSPSIPVLPSAAQVRMSLKDSIKSAVQATNELLGTIEDASDKVTRPSLESYRHLEKKGEAAVRQAHYYYDRRKSYGPQLVVGSSLLVGGLVGLRRGRLPALATGSVAGFIAYLGIYEIEIHRLPDVVFGKQDK